MHAVLTADTQYTDGVTGALIVYPTAAATAPADFPTWDHELVVEMSDLYHTFSSELLADYLSVGPPARTSRPRQSLIRISQPFGIDGTPGDEPVPDGGVRTLFCVFARGETLTSSHRRL